MDQIKQHNFADLPPFKLDRISVQWSRQIAFAHFHGSHPTMEYHAGPIREQWAGQSLPAGRTPTLRGLNPQ